MKLAIGVRLGVVFAMARPARGLPPAVRVRPLVMTVATTVLGLLWRRRQVRVAMAVAPVAAPDLAPHPDVA